MMLAGTENGFTGGGKFVEFWAGAGKTSICAAVQKASHQRA
jgi:hypothetical protein